MTFSRSWLLRLHFQVTILSSSIYFCDLAYADPSPHTFPSISNNLSLLLLVAYYNSQADGRIDRGRPTKTWVDNIMEDVKAQGMDIR